VSFDPVRSDRFEVSRRKQLHPQELCNPGIHRTSKNLLRIADLKNYAILDYRDYIGQHEGFDAIVRNVHACGFERAQQAAQVFTEFFTHFCVEGGKRLVEEEQLWLNRQRSGESNSLFFSAAQRRWATTGKVLCTDQAQHLFDPLRRVVLLPKAESHILLYRKVREKGVILKHEA
jgi:hypothetical protein